MNNDRQKQEAIERVGLFGGTFNPIHRGHVQVAGEVFERYHLDRICFIPCALPPHKMRGTLAPAADRLEMIRQALRHKPRLTVSDIEVRRPGPSYTIDTLEEFRDRSSDASRIFFLLGLDAFLEIHTWKAFRRLLDMAAMIVMSRPMELRPNASLRETVSSYARRHLSDRYQPSEDGYRLRHPVKRSIYVAPVTPLDIASSQIRDRIRRGEAVDRWIDPVVAQYIDQKGLYR